MSLRDKFPGQIEDRLPIEGLDEATQTSSEPEVALPLEEFVQVIATRRRQNLVRNPEVSSSPAEPSSTKKETYNRTGGAFGGALKRRIELTDSDEMRSRTNEYDIGLVTPQRIRESLFPQERTNQVYDGVLFTAGEYGALTISANEVAQRVGANVMNHTSAQTPTERHARRTEVVTDTLKKRHQRAQDEIERLAEVSGNLRLLQREIKSPGYSHMRLPDMDELMRKAERAFVTMFEAIVDSDSSLGTERVESLSAALAYKLTADDYKETFGMWRDMTPLAFNWTNLKIVRLISSQKRIETRLQENP